MAYVVLGLVAPDEIQAYSLMDAATSAAFDGIASWLEICQEAAWSSSNTFRKHYKLDSFISANAAFGRKVVQ